jgi:hypothetical protein
MRSSHGPYLSYIPILKYNVMLRRFSSISDMLHSVDVSASAVAYNGTIMYTTCLGAYTQLVRVNVVHMYNTSIDKRLLKYYTRGYALCFPFLNPSLLCGIHTLGTLRFHISERHGFYLRSTISNTDTTEDIPVHTLSMDEVDKWNVQQLLHGTKNYIVTSTMFEHIFGDYRLGDIFTLDTYTRTIRNYARMSMLDIPILRDIFQMSEADVLAIVHAIYNNVTDLQNLLQPYVTTTIGIYFTEPDYIQWIVPFVQTTMLPEEYYGIQFQQHVICTDDILIDSLHSVIRMFAIREKDDICAICMSTIGYSQRNHVILKCAHIFHYSPTDICGGLSRWFRTNNTCPTCRQEC